MINVAKKIPNLLWGKRSPLLKDVNKTMFGVVYHARNKTVDKIWLKVHVDTIFRVKQDLKNEFDA